MYTRCPECSTCFRVTDRHLAIAKGKVRCGKCQAVFNAPEHAIDDLPISQITAQTRNKAATSVIPSKKTEIKKPLISTRENKVTAVTPVEKELKIKKRSTSAPVFDASATIITDISGMNKNEVNSIDLDSDSDDRDKMDETEDDLFDDSFDLNAAIDELTQATDDNASDKTTHVDAQPTKTEHEKYLPEKNHNGDVFSTGAYDATNAASITDILNEMEGQLSLDIDESDNNKKEYDANKEFDFLKLDDEDTSDQEQAQEEHFDIELDANITQSKNSNEADIDEDELFDQTDLSDFQDSDVEKNIDLHTGENEVPFQLRHDLERLHAPSSRLFSPLFTIPFVIFLLLLSFSQLAYFRAHELVNLVPSARPVLEAFCETIGCYYSGPRDTKQIELLSRDVRLHPKEKKALLISAAMINNAYFAQPYPDIHIRLSDISGNVVAERIFNAKTYMGKLSNPFLLMKSKTPVHINFEVVDPGKDAINFEFTFL